MDWLTEPLGPRLPSEARVWWAWHDGVDAGAIAVQDERLIGPGWPFVPLAEAVAERQRCRQVSDEMLPITAGREPLWWASGWFPLTVDQPLADLVIDGDVAENEPTPVRRVTPPERQPMPEPSVPSLGALVQRWIEAIDRGVWTREPGVGRWCKPERMPNGWRMNDVVLSPAEIGGPHSASSSTAHLRRDQNALTSQALEDRHAASKPWQHPWQHP
jgi:hypothetical protein